MISNLNRFTFMGHLGADAKQANGTAPVTFSIAVSSHWNDNAGDRQTRTDSQNIVVFGNLRKYAAKLKKGDRVYVEAEARNNNYERKVGTETDDVLRDRVPCRRHRAGCGQGRGRDRH